MGIIVREITETDYPTWDAYVRAHSEGTFCHLVGWKTVIETGAGQSCPYLLAEKAGNIVGILPLSLRKSLLFGDALISSMFAVYGGALASDDDAYAALAATAWGMAEELDLSAVSYRTIKARHRGKADWVIDDVSAATFKKQLGNSADEILLDIPRKQRAVVRKSLKAGLTCDWGRDLDTFYKLYAVSVRNLGTPVFPKKLFSAFLEVFADDVEIQIIKAPDGQAVASLMSFYYKDQVLPYYAGGNPSARKYGAHDFMYYQLMLRAREKDKTIFDFGRSKIGSGPYKFKKNWGFEPITLEYETQLVEGAVLQDLSPTNKKFELMVKFWKKLPVGVANIVGPPIARHLG